MRVVPGRQERLAGLFVVVGSAIVPAEICCNGLITYNSVH
jgi:hypothetical protein